MNERQLHLFKGKRQRGVTLPRAKEFELHCMVADVLRRWINLGWCYTHMPMGERRDMVTAMRLKRMGTTPGWPDFVFFGPRSRVVWLELKRPGGGQLSSDQDIRAAQLEECGHTFLCTNDFQMAIDMLRDHDIVTSRISVT